MAIRTRRRLPVANGNKAASLIVLLSFLLLCHEIRPVRSLSFSRVSNRQRQPKTDRVGAERVVPTSPTGIPVRPSSAAKTPRQSATTSPPKSIASPVASPPKKRNDGSKSKSPKLGDRSPATATPEPSLRGLKTEMESLVNMEVVKDIRTQLQYARNGHAVLRNLFARSLHSTSDTSVPFLTQLRETLLTHGQTHELAAWRQKIMVAADHTPTQAHELAMSCHTVEQCRVQYQRLVKSGSSSREDDALPFLQYFNTWRTIPDVKHVANALAPAAALLMDVPSVRLYQDAIFWKRPWDGPTPWHVDARMAPFDTSHMITFWIPLQPVQRSGLVFCSKSQADFALPFWNEPPTGSNLSADASTSPWHNLEERYSNRVGKTGSDTSIVDYMPLALGDVTVHSGWTLHCADGGADNDVVSVGSARQRQSPSCQSRLALAITLVDARAPIRHDAVAAVQRLDARHGSNKADREDIWSYQDWVHQVPAMTSHWNHPLAPILWRRSFGLPNAVCPTPQGRRRET